VVPHQANKRILDATAKKLGSTPIGSWSPSISTPILRPHRCRSRSTSPCATAASAGRPHRPRGDGRGFTWGAAVVLTEPVIRRHFPAN
jgi:hypothetical protein